jgi:hypothetical protein
MVVGTFTPELARSFEHLRQAVAEVEDGTARETITAIVDDLVVNLENQMLLVFANCAISNNDRETVLIKKDMDQGLLDYYRECVAPLKAPAMKTLQYGELLPEIRGSAEKVQSASVTLPAAVASEHAVLRSVAPENEAVRTIMSYFYCLTESLAHNLQAERAIFYLHQKSSQQLRAVCTIPDSLEAQKGLCVSVYQGVQGLTFSSNFAVRVDVIDADMRKVYFPNNPEVYNAILFPVVDQIHNMPIGVIECVNKTRGLHWTESDEGQMGQAAALLQYYLCHYGQHMDFLNVPVFNPVHLHMIAPYRPGFYNPELGHMPEAIGIRKRQLVARVSSSSALVALKKDAVKKTLFEVKSLGHVQELCEYLDEIDGCFKTSVSDLVASKHREAEARDQIQKLSVKLKVAEENTNHIQEQLTDAKRVILAQKIAAGDGTSRHDGFGTYRSNAMTQRQSLTQRSLPKAAKAMVSSNSSVQGGVAPTGLPPLQQDTLRPAVLHDFMANASRALDELRKKAVGGSDAMQRHRQFSTPQPLRSSTFM